MSGRISHRLVACLLGGLMFLGVAGQASANLVVNGDFETGDFTGWAYSGNGVFDGVDTQMPQGGIFAAFFGTPDGGSGISQSIATAIGAMYQIDFWIATESDVTGLAIPNHFEFDWDGAQQFSLVDASGGLGYTHYSFTLTATTASTALAFNFGSDPAFWDFDTVSVTEATTRAPEPGSLALLALGGALAAFARRRRA